MQKESEPAADSQNSAQKVVMYGTEVCPYCQMAGQLLKSRGVAQIEKIFIDRDPEQRKKMLDRTQQRTVPQIFIGETHVGGYDNLLALDKKGELHLLLFPESQNH